MDPLAICALTACIAAVSTGLAIMVLLLCRGRPVGGESAELTGREPLFVRRAHATIAICFFVAGASALVFVGAEAHGPAVPPTADAGLWRLLRAGVVTD